MTEDILAVLADREREGWSQNQRIDSLESIPGLHKPLQIRDLVRQSFFAGSGTAHSSIQDTACKLYVTLLKDFIHMSNLHSFESMVTSMLLFRGIEESPQPVHSIRVVGTELLPHHCELFPKKKRKFANLLGKAALAMSFFYCQFCNKIVRGAT
jgi:hypothetical protein